MLLTTGIRKRFEWAAPCPLLELQRTSEGLKDPGELDPSNVDAPVRSYVQSGDSGIGKEHGPSRVSFL